MNQFVTAHRLRGDLTRRQEHLLLKLVDRIGLERYRQHKATLGISYALPIPKLSKRQASHLIKVILADLEAER